MRTNDHIIRINDFKKERDKRNQYDGEIVLVFGEISINGENKTIAVSDKTQITTIFSYFSIWAIFLAR